MARPKMDAEASALRRASKLLAPFDLQTRRRMLWWLVWREGEMPAEYGRYLAGEINRAPVEPRVTPAVPGTDGTGGG